MNIAVTLRTHLEFEDLEDFETAQELLSDEMTPEEIIELAQRQGYPINIDVEES